MSTLNIFKVSNNVIGESWVVAQDEKGAVALILKKIGRKSWLDLKEMTIVFCCPEAELLRAPTKKSRKP